MEEEFSQNELLTPRLAAITGGGGGFPVAEPEPGKNLAQIIKSIMEQILKSIHA